MASLEKGAFKFTVSYLRPLDMRAEIKKIVFLDKKITVSMRPKTNNFNW